MTVAIIWAMQGQLNLAQWIGPGVTFISGLSTMLFIVYRGPLNDIRNSVNDLGIASASFIAYIHRVLQISHTFSFYYLKEQITFEEMKKSNALIEDAMKDTVKTLKVDNWVQLGKLNQNALNNLVSDSDQEKD